MTAAFCNVTAGPNGRALCSLSRLTGGSTRYRLFISRPPKTDLRHKIKSRDRDLLPTAFEKARGSGDATAKPPVPHPLDGFALSPIRAVFSDSIGRAVETG